MMETRKRKLSESTPIVKTGQSSSTYISDFGRFHSAFSAEITTQLLQLCERDQGQFGTRTEAGAARKQVVCHHDTMTELSDEQWIELDEKIKRLGGSADKICGGKHINIKYNNQSLYEKTKNTTFADVFGAGCEPAILCCHSGYKNLLSMPAMIPKEYAACDLLSGGTIYTPLHVDQGI